MENKKPYYVLFHHYYDFPTGQGYQNVFSDYDLDEVKAEAESMQGESEFRMYILTIDGGSNHFEAMAAAEDFLQMVAYNPRAIVKKKELHKAPYSESDIIGARLTPIKREKVYS